MDTIGASKSEELKDLVSNQSSEIKEHFPFGTIRPTQADALDAVSQSYTQKKKFTIIEAPTGIGKSGIAIAAASHAKTVPSYGGFEQGAYILSPQKTLTAQYMKDFEPMGLRELKGKANYFCSPFDMDCESAGLLHSEHDAVDSNCSGYKPAKKAFCRSPLGVTNFSYYLNETKFSGQLKNRNMLVLDEGHNTENQILSMADIEITKRRCEEIDISPLSMPFIKPGENLKAHNWLSTTFRAAAMSTLARLLDELEVLTNREAKLKAAKKHSALEKFVQRLSYFINSEDQGDWLVWTDKDSGSMIVKPLTATLFADEILFRKAQKIVIMSATLLDFGTFLRNLGINRDECVEMAVPSEFPIENRPIFFKPVGNMSHKTIDETLPNMAAMVEKILVKYLTKKGIVHTHSYRINKYLVDFLTSRGHGVRIITHSNIPGDRDRAVRDHIESPEPTVLFSPSMTEGLDLKDELSRFSVIVKVPYPYLDPYVKARMNRDPQWYSWLTALALVQATGRSNRHKSDKAHHYILDSAFEYFLTKNQTIFPKWWTDSIVF